MKDHELRELINDVTAVARIYVSTQQLREQISHLIVPVFAKAQAELKDAEKEGEEQARLNGMGSEREARQLSQIENLNRQLDFEVKQRIELRKELAAAQQKIITPPTPTPSSGNTP